MNQPKNNNSKAKVKADDHKSSSEDEFKPRKVGKKGSGKSRGKKNQEKRKPNETGSKDSKKSQVDNKYTDIKLNSYLCCSQDQSPKDAHIVVIDTYGITCQLWEMYKARSASMKNVTEKKLELYAVSCASLAILENIVLGVRYSDIPTEVVEMFPRTRVCVRSDYMEAVHACSIPKGKVYIGRGNKSVGHLTAFIVAVDPTDVTDPVSLKRVEDTVHTLLTNRGFDSPLVLPPEGQDACLNLEIQLHNGTTYKSEVLVHHLRSMMLKVNAAIADEENYQLYVPVLCEQSEICYVISYGGDVQLVSFMPLVNEDTIKRLKMYALSFRFFISYVRVMKENKTLVDAEAVENVMLEHGYVPVFEKHGIMMLNKRMDEGDDDVSIIVEGQTSVPNIILPSAPVEVVKFDYNSAAKHTCYTNNKFMSTEELKGYVGKRMRISNDGIVECETDRGYGYTMLSSRLRADGKAVKDAFFGKLPGDINRKWSAWTEADSKDKVAQWVHGLPQLPNGW
jgi:hypothetical protein